MTTTPAITARGDGTAAVSTIEDLETEITTLCAHLGAAEYRLLRAIGEFDARKGWWGIGIASCAHWLGWKCGISRAAAHEHVRVARALRELPEIGAAMARGELSYSKVRALTRVATPATDGALARLGRQGTAMHVEEIVRRYRRVRRAGETATIEAQRSRELRYRWDEDGSLVIYARLPAERGALVLQALEAAADTLRRAARGETESSAEDSPHRDGAPAPSPYRPDQSWAARRADALALMAETLLAHGATEASPGDRHQVVVHVDAAVLADPSRAGRAHIEDGPPLAVETVRRLCCDAALVPMTDDADGNPLDVGRKTRAIPPALRRALKSRDGGCRFPGCSHRRFADGHHIQHWADGGETKLDNLVLLCRTHHRLVHEEGFTLARDADGALAFRAPDGRAIDEKPTYAVLAADSVLRLFDTNRALGITARTCVPEWFGEKPAYDWITDSLCHRDDRAHASPAPRDDP